MAGDDLGFIYRYLPGKGNAPTLLLLHGTGGDESDLIPLGQHLAPGVGLLSPRGPVLEHGMPRFFRRFPDGSFDVADLKLRAHDLAAFVEAAATQEGFDRGAVVAVGYSNGANIAAAALLAHPGVFAAAVLFHAMLPYRPAGAVNLPGVPIFLTGGRRDIMIGPAGTQALAEALGQTQAEVTLRWQPGGHELTRGEMDEARQWLSAQGLLSASRAESQLP